MKKKEKFIVTLSYNGENFHGASKQKNNEITIQNIFEKALSKVSSYSQTKLMSRTDKHVNAYEQIIEVECETDITLFSYKISKIIENKSNNSINIKNIRKFEGEFIRNRKKTYLYKIMLEKNGALCRTHAYFYQLNKISNLENFKNLLKELDNKKFDYSIFCKSLKENKRPTEQTLNIEIEDILLDKKIKTLNIYISGKCFLYKQIRLLIGTVVNICDKAIAWAEKEKIYKYKNLAYANALYLHSIIF